MNRVLQAAFNLSCTLPKRTHYAEYRARPESEIVRNGKTKKIKLNINGVEYESISKAAVGIGMSRCALQLRIDRGLVVLGRENYVEVKCKRERRW